MKAPCPSPRARREIALSVAICLFMLPLSATADFFGKKTAKPPTPPKLVVQITIDQLRGDLPMRYRDRLPEGGFRYLLEQGTHYANAHYRHANTETAVGHATLATGADPSRHGITGNDWIDPVSGAFVYNTEDERHHLIGKEAKPHRGVSPRNLLSSTTGDEMVLANAGKTRVFSVSGKDRGAILPGGHAGKAFWYSKSSGRFVTSTYYYDAYPEWVAAWNDAKPADVYRGKTWELSQPRETYFAKDLDDRPYEADFGELGRTFPHHYGDNKYTNLVVGLTPAIDELTLDFATKVIDNENLGDGEATDFLAVSFSATDYVGHLFGPSSLESEDNILRLDRVLASFFAFLDEKVGLENTLIVLSADHGGPEAPEYAQSIGIEAGRFSFDYFKKPNELTAAIKQRYGRDDFILSHNHPYLYLNYDAIRDAKQDPGQVERFIAIEATKIQGVRYAMSRSELLDGRYVDAPIQLQIRRNFHPDRSGAIHLVPDQYWFLHSTDEAAKMGLAGLAAIHGSPWSYDTFVPIFFAGHGVSAQTITRRVETTDVAPTISAYLGVKPPSGAIGNPLEEVFKAK
ncbi:MAG: putative AlkP superfamily pyrophosphatase or phosphodiesterase [Hyphomicrobiaceae bacterium]|jgi:predicted AlkP superfamily pyrophosphatase or phosphodiesterase